MNYLQKITVTKFELNENGIVITYDLLGRELHMVIANEDVAHVLESIGNDATELSQYDAILLAANHETEKALKARTKRITTEMDLVEFSKNFFVPSLND